jgi:hypothetical protein
MSDEILTAILTEVQNQGKCLAALDSKMDSLVGAAGQPGRITKVEDDVDALKASKNYLWGFGAGLVFVEGAVHFLMHKLGVK